MDETGLLSIWQSGAISEATHCVRKIQQEMNNKKIKDKKRLSLNDLSGAFAILGGGYFIAFFAFFLENYYGRFIRYRQNHLLVSRDFLKL